MLSNGGIYMSLSRKSAFSAVTCLTLSVFLLNMPTPSFAESSPDVARLSKLEDRVRDLEARMAKVESSQHAGMGMMMDHQHQPGTMPNHPANKMMGTAPQGNMPSDPGSAMKDDAMEMPPMGNAPQGGGMQQQGGGMGDM